MAENFIEKEHEKLIRILKVYLEKEGYEVNVDKTTEYAGVKADMEATKNKEKLCIEVINGKKIETQEIKRKWEAISGNRNCEFCLFTPEKNINEIKKLLEKWAIYYRKIWTYSP